MSTDYFCAREGNPDLESRNFLLSTFVQWFARQSVESSVIETMYNLMKNNSYILITLFIWRVDNNNIGFEAHVEAQGQVVTKASICLIEADARREEIDHSFSASREEWYTDFDAAVHRAFTRASEESRVDVDLS